MSKSFSALNGSVIEGPKVYLYPSGVEGVYRWEVRRAPGVVKVLDVIRTRQKPYIINKAPRNLWYNGYVNFIPSKKLNNLVDLFDQDKGSGDYKYKPSNILQVRVVKDTTTIVCVGDILRENTTHAIRLPNKVFKIDILKLQKLNNLKTGVDIYNIDFDNFIDLLSGEEIPLNSFKYFNHKELPTILPQPTLVKPVVVAEFSNDYLKGWNDAIDMMINSFTTLKK